VGIAVGAPIVGVPIAGMPMLCIPMPARSIITLDITRFLSWALAPQAQLGEQLDRLAHRASSCNGGIIKMTCIDSNDFDGKFPFCSFAQGPAISRFLITKSITVVD
jgi:hypothetical protein